MQKELEAQLKTLLAPVEALKKEYQKAIATREGAAKSLGTAKSIQSENANRLAEQQKDAEAAAKQLEVQKKALEDAKASGDKHAIDQAQKALDAFRPLAEKTIAIGKEAKAEEAKNKKAVEDADKALRDARFAEAQAAAKAQEAEDKIRVEKSKLEKKIQDKIAEIKVLNAQLAEISNQRIALEAKAKELDVVVTSAKQVKDAADQDLKDLEESIAKLKKIIAKLLELAK